MPRASTILLALAAWPLAPVLYPLPPSGALAVKTESGWETWWEPATAPTQWTGPLPAVVDRIAWKRASPGVELGHFSLAGEGEAYRIRVLVARLDPAQLEFRLVKPTDGRIFAGRWSVDESPAGALFAINAGQFSDQPWGWVRVSGDERQAPGKGPLAPAVVVDSMGRVRMVEPDSIELVRHSAVTAFQSYPTLLSGDGLVPEAVRAVGADGPVVMVDLTHRDSRIALGTLRDGKILVAMTRFEALGGALENLPFGLTTPEMSAVMGALGCARAVLLDGGISSQMLVQVDGKREIWSGWRRVALGLIAMKR